LIKEITKPDRLIAIGGELDQLNRLLYTIWPTKRDRFVYLGDDIDRGRYNLDTGAVYGKPLTACDVLTRQVWQVS